MLFVGKVGKGGQEQPSTARRAPSAERGHYCSPTSHHHGKLCGGAGEKEAPAFGADFFSLEKHGALSSPRKRHHSLFHGHGLGRRWGSRRAPTAAGAAAIPAKPRRVVVVADLAGGDWRERARG